MSDQTQTRRIDDAGERIEGARKDWKLRAMAAEDLATMTDEEIISEARKDNVWPKPDWEEAVKGGMEPLAAAHVKLIRDRLAQEPKPRAGMSQVEVRRAFVTMTSMLRDRFMACRTPDEVKAVYAQVVASFPDRITSSSGSGLVFFSVYKGRSCPFTVEWGDASKARSMLQDGFPGTVPAWRKGVRAIAAPDGTCYLTRGPVILQEGFGSEDEAFAWLEKQAASEKKPARERSGKAEPSRPHLDRLERSGLEDWRGGRDVSPDEFIETFGFRGVQFGLWLPDGERQQVLNHGYDACRDLACVLGLEPSAMSLEGTLAVAFGARGKGGKAAAHYEPGQRVVNMSRLSGAGSFAHEFGHALDHWLGTGSPYMDGIPSASGWYGWPASRERLIGHRGAGAVAAWDALAIDILYSPMEKEDRVRGLEERIGKLKKALAANAANIEGHLAMDPRRHSRTWLKKARDWDRTQTASLGHLEAALAAASASDGAVFGRRQSSFVTEAAKLSGSGDYWRRPTELFARAFETWVFDEIASRGGRSDYLVHAVEDGRYSGPEWKGDPYPSGAERARIGASVRSMVEAVTPCLSPDPEGRLSP